MSFDWLSSKDRTALLALLEERFGIAPERFEGYRFCRRGDYVHAVTEEAAEAAGDFDGEEAGLPVAKLTRSGSMKPSSRGMQFFGSWAGRNVIDVTALQLKDLVAGRSLDHEGPKGFVLLRLDGFIAGVGLAREGRLLSQLPRSVTEHLALTGEEKLR